MGRRKKKKKKTCSLQSYSRFLADRSSLGKKRLPRGIKTHGWRPLDTDFFLPPSCTGPRLNLVWAKKMERKKKKFYTTEFIAFRYNKTPCLPLLFFRSMRAAPHHRRRRRRLLDRWIFLVRFTLRTAAARFTTAAALS